MDDHRKSYDELLAENLRLRGVLNAMQSNQNPVKSSSNQQQKPQLMHGNSWILLNNYALELSYVPSEELYTFIVSNAIQVFETKTVILSEYNEATSGLQIKYSNLDPVEESKLERILGKKLNAIHIRLTEAQHDYICSEPFRILNSLYELTFGVIPGTIAQKAEKTLNLGWFIQLGLIFKNKLMGTLVLLGTKTQRPPDHDAIRFFCSITANAVGRRIAEETLAEREARFRQLFDEAPLGYQSLSPDGCFIDVNQIWLNTLGYQRKEIIGKKIGDFLTPDSQSIFAKKFAEFLRKGKVSCELEMIHKNGEIRCVEFEGRIGYDSEGHFKQSHCIFKDITSQRKAERLARERQEMFEAIAHYTANWESWFDNSGKIIWTNPAALRYSGYTPEEITAMPDFIEILVAEQDREKVRTVLKEALSGKDASAVEFTMVRKDQSEFRISVSWNHIFNKQGNSMGIRTSGQDVTLHRQAEEAVSYNENLYRKMVDNAPFGMHFYDLTPEDELIFTSANQAANKILNLDHTGLVGLRIEEAFPSLSGTDVSKHYIDAAKNNTTWVTDQIVYSDNRISGAYEVKAFQTVPGKMVAIFSDITKRKQAEEELNENKQLFEALASVSPVGIFRTDANGNTTYVNPKWMELTGLSFEDAIASKYLSAIHPDDRDERVTEWNETVKSGRSVSSEYRFLRPDSSIVWVHGQAVPEIADHTIKGYIGTITDITELKNAEDELLKAKEKAEASNRLKTAFMGNISHEIRTPLNGIIGFAELITSGNNTPEENQECIEFLNHSINRLTKIIDNIMDVSLMMTGNIAVRNEPFSVDVLVYEIFKRYELTAARKNLTFTIENKDTEKAGHIISDRALISRILSELVDNAIKFTNNGSIVISYHVLNGRLFIQVSDSGIGVTHEFLPFIFEPFVQQDVYSARVNNSNGLGLSIVHEAVNIMGGEVTADSREGSGTRISVEIPVKETVDERIAGLLKNNSAPSTGKPVILIVEDEEINMIYLKRVLNQKGYSLLFATNAPDAIRFIEEGTTIDLILMDMKMPGMDGFEATRRIKSLRPELKIAAVTAYASDTDREACIRAGCDDYISKPFQKSDLFQLLDRLYN